MHKKEWKIKEQPLTKGPWCGPESKPLATTEMPVDGVGEGPLMVCVREGGAQWVPNN